MSNPFNLDAPIVPGKSAAGVSIGDSIEDILMQLKPFTITELPQEKRYHFGSVNLWVNNEGKVKKIGLYPGYRGKIKNFIGIGSKISEVLESLGTVVIDEEDNLVVHGLPGWCFESSEWHSPQQLRPIHQARLVRSSCSRKINKELTTLNIQRSAHNVVVRCGLILFSVIDEVLTHHMCHLHRSKMTF